MNFTDYITKAIGIHAPHLSVLSAFPVENCMVCPQHSSSIVSISPSMMLKTLDSLWIIRDTHYKAQSERSNGGHCDRPIVEIL